MRTITESEAKKMIESAVRAAHKRATTGFIILFLGTLGSFWVGYDGAQDSRDRIIKTGNAVAIDGCNRDFGDRQGLRKLLIAGRTLVESQRKAGKVPADQAAIAAKFYTDQLVALPLPDCREAVGSITDEKKNVRQPVPRYPGDSK